jgi:hypothetical protein
VSNAGSLVAYAPDNWHLVQVVVFGPHETLQVIDGHAVFVVPDAWDGLMLVDIEGYVTQASSSGSPTFQVRNATKGFNVLLTKLIVAANMLRTDATAPYPLIDSTRARVNADDMLFFDCNVAGTGAMGFVVNMAFG